MHAHYVSWVQLCIYNTPLFNFTSALRRRMAYLVGWLVVSEYELTCVQLFDDYLCFNSTVMMGLDLLVSDLDEEFDAFAIPPLNRVFSSRQMSAKFLHPKSISSKQISNSSLSDAGSRHCETVG